MLRGSCSSASTEDVEPPVFCVAHCSIPCCFPAPAEQQGCGISTGLASSQSSSRKATQTPSRNATQVGRRTDSHSARTKAQVAPTLFCFPARTHRAGQCRGSVVTHRASGHCCRGAPRRCARSCLALSQCPKGKCGNNAGALKQLQCHQAVTRSTPSPRGPPPANTS